MEKNNRKLAGRDVSNDNLISRLLIYENTGCTEVKKTRATLLDDTFFLEAYTCNLPGMGMVHASRNL